MTKDEALKLALEALEYHTAQTRPIHQTSEAITAIKEALAQPEQEPMAWMDKDGDVLSASVVSGKGLRNIPLYTTPPQRTWVGLTDEEKHAIRYSHMTSAEFIEVIEAKLKQKNGYAEEKNT